MSENEPANQHSFHFGQPLILDSDGQPVPSEPQQRLSEASSVNLPTQPSTTEANGRSSGDLTTQAEQSLRSLLELARCKDPGVELGFKKTEPLIVGSESFAIQAQFYEFRARFLEQQGDIAGAKHCYLLARRSALCLSVVSDSGVLAEERLLYEHLRVQNLGDNSFKNLLMAARSTDSAGVRCDAWFAYLDKASGTPDRLAARVPCSVEDFQRLLEAARQKRGEGE